MTVLAIDYGTRRIGIALGQDGQVVSGNTVQVRSVEEVITQLTAIIQREGVQTLVIGLPYRMDGTEQEEVQRVREFADQLAKNLQLPVVFLDERLTSVEATSRMESSGLSPKEQQEKVDEMVSRLLLEQYFRDISGQKQ